MLYFFIDFFSKWKEKQQKLTSIIPQNLRDNIKQDFLQSLAYYNLASR